LAAFTPSRPTTGGGQWASDFVLLGGRRGGGVVLRPHALRPEESAVITNNDRFILSKGHAAPLLYAAWAEAGFVSGRGLLKNCARIGSDLEGHSDAAAAVRGRGRRVRWARV